MSRFILVTDNPDFAQRVRKAISGGLPGGLRVLTDVLIPKNPQELLADEGEEAAEVVLVGPGVAPEDALHLAAVFDVQLPSISVVLVAVPEPDLALAAMRTGIRDILDPDADEKTIRVLLERAGRSAATRHRNLEAPLPKPADNARTIVVASPKGGVGKTTLATNIAVALGRIGPMSTVLVDLDAQFGDVAGALQLDPEHTLLDAVTGAAKQDPMVLKAFLSVHHSSIYVLCAPKRPADADRITGEDVQHLLEQLAGEFRYVVIDTAPGLGEQTLAALEHASDALMVCTMDVPGVRGLRKELDVFDQLGLVAPHRRKVVVNMAERSSPLSIRDIEATLRGPVDNIVPRSKEIAFSTNKGVPLLQSSSRGPAVKALNRLAESFRPDPKPRKGMHKRAELT
ncbi:AAA family ATPase [Arthrobacter sp. SDTb3-6]|uniref:AAA family ATPase n=1 Tax=Arthrobacter sp. SDTb3-6 TaxID=2713571 RepID=UPI00159E0ACC|nr:AAA family ATPase [Arthrobacter sp. SDTb3-6]NVN00075.1 AAA family ATPase [Arthrobacter sp. SDTb3-6]